MLLGFLITYVALKIVLFAEDTGLLPNTWRYLGASQESLRNVCMEHVGQGISKSERIWIANWGNVAVDRLALL